MREAMKRGAPIEIDEFERRLRDQEARRASLGDPLRELARLMQDQEHDDTAQRYGRIFDDGRPSAEEPEPDFGFHPDARHGSAAAQQEDFVPHPAWQEPALHSQGDDLPPPLRGSFSDEHDQQDVEQLRADWGRRPAAPADFGAPHDAEFYPENLRQAQRHAPGGHTTDDRDFNAAQGDEYYSDDQGAYEDFPAEPYAEASSEETERVKRSFRVKPWHAVAVAGLVGALGVGWGIARIKGVAGSREIATIAAPEGPTKVAPAVADASQTAKEDATVLDRGVETPVRNVVPHQEAPVEPVVEPPREPSSQTFRRVKTVAIREDSGVNPATAPAAVERAANDAPAAPPAASTTTPQNAAPPATTAQKQPPKKKVAAAPSPAAAPTAAPAQAAKAEEAAAPSEQTAEPPASGSSFVQFGAAANEGEARVLAKKVVQKYGSRLGGRKPTWKTAEVGDKTVYRVRVGGLSREAATSLCRTVKSDGGDCYVAN